MVIRTRFDLNGIELNRLFSENGYMRRGGFFVQEKRRLYQQSWFIMMLLVSPLFVVGLILAWREKGIPKVVKIMFTAVWIYAVIFTFQTQNVGRMFMTQEKTEAVDIALMKEQSGIMRDYAKQHETVLGEIEETQPTQKFRKPTYDSAYVIKTTTGTFNIYLKDRKIELVTDKENKKIE